MSRTPGLRDVPNLLRSEVDAFHQAAGIDPLLARVPALDARRIQQILSHVAALQGDLPQALLGEGKILRQPHRADDVLRGTLDLGEIGLLRAEEIRQEQGPHDRAHVVAATSW